MFRPSVMQITIFGDTLKWYSHARLSESQMWAGGQQTLQATALSGIPKYSQIQLVRRTVRKYIYVEMIVYVI